MEIAVVEVRDIAHPLPIGKFDVALGAFDQAFGFKRPDDAVEVRVDEVLSRRRSPMTQESRLHVLDAEHDAAGIRDAEHVLDRNLGINEFIGRDRSGDRIRTYQKLRVECRSRRSRAAAARSRSPSDRRAFSVPSNR